MKLSYVRGYTIMAVAAVATTGCDFCLDLHSKGAKRAGAT